MSLTSADIDRFMADGFVRVEAAVDKDVADACRDELWDATGYDRHDASTWTDTLVRIDWLGTADASATRVWTG